MPRRKSLGGPESPARSSAAAGWQCRKDCAPPAPAGQAGRAPTLLKVCCCLSFLRSNAIHPTDRMSPTMNGHTGSPGWWASRRAMSLTETDFPRARRSNVNKGRIARQSRFAQTALTARMKGRPNTGTGWCPAVGATDVAMEDSVRRALKTLSARYAYLRQQAGERYGTEDPAPRGEP